VLASSTQERGSHLPGVGEQVRSCVRKSEKKKLPQALGIFSELRMPRERRKLTIGLDLGDRWSFYCVRFRCQRSKLAQIVAVIVAVQIDARFLFW